MLATTNGLDKFSARQPGAPKVRAVKDSENTNTILTHKGQLRTLVSTSRNMQIKSEFQGVQN
ncbi:hypothetical protein B9Q04_15350 [Candidatus Marsarchaeota G2 archaeon BE_D]|jgi:hypothetical protein|uniref:Uncharacterized protein n=1 Tax=Candidatus Marsarchaeota G2 archaeon BE_D TaxID=1978158 RepID=A0A2R6C763_9ARCH|nr:MAG: hypothetical protein B9Q04_15350 [Candidatus Marsarchaeota G2 archaeon BE_D]